MVKYKVVTPFMKSVNGRDTYEKGEVIEVTVERAEAINEMFEPYGKTMLERVETKKPKKENTVQEGE